VSKDFSALIGGVAAVVAITAAYARWLDVTNATTVALSFLLVVLVVAATSRLWVAVVSSLIAMASFNFFFLPPVGTLAIADPRNWVALGTFLTVSLVASHLSSVARARAEEAIAGRAEVARLFEFSRDILLLNDNEAAMTLLVRDIARRFELDYVAIALPQGTGWRTSEAGSLPQALETVHLSEAIASLDRPMVVERAGQVVRLLPLCSGNRMVGVLAAAGRLVESGTLAALGGITAIAIERSRFLEERKTADLARRSEELKSALLAVLAHDLRTPLTAIRVAASNLQASWPTEEERKEQNGVILTEVERLSRLFQNILEMARIEAGTIGADLQWVYASQILEAALDQVGDELDGHRVHSAAASDRLVRVDPRLTATALAHLLENAAQYAPLGSEVAVSAAVTDEGLELRVRDRGVGIAPHDLPYIFDRFYRGAGAAQRAAGTGMGLAIARGLLAAEHGWISVENCTDGGALFTVVVPAAVRLAPALSMEPAI
jgi:two-component system sensor histidine kinase KdpD